MASKVYVWPDRHVPGWSGGTSAHFFEPTKLRTALSTSYTTDAHCVAYRVPGEAKVPRLTVDSLPLLIEAGQEPVLTLAFVDVDNPDHAPWYPDRDTMAALLEQAPGNPILYSTRAGYRMVYLPKKPIPVTHARSYLVALHKRLAAHGIEADPSGTQWARSYRLPSVNRDGVAMVAIVVGTLERSTWHPMTAADTPRGAVGALIGPSEAPEGAEPTTACLDALGRSAGASRWLAVLRSGAPLAEPGNRDRGLMQCIGAIASAMPDPDPSVLWYLLKSSVVAMDSAAPGAPSVGKAWGKVREICTKEIASRQNQGEWAISDDGKTDSDSGPLIVNLNSAYYVKNGDDYQGPYSPAGLLPAMRDLHPGAVVRTAKGAPRSAPSLLLDYGAAAITSQIEYGRTVTEYDGACLVLAGPIRRPVEPKRDDTIAAWLEALAGDLTPQLVRWLAGAMRLDRPSAAVFLRGPSGIGKGLFAHLVASLWGTEPVPWERAVSRFNLDSLRRSPVVWIDEGIPYERGISDVFRRLITTDTHSVEAKYQGVTQLKGHIRLVVGANRVDALPFLGRHTADDIDALNRRVLYIPTGKKARIYLENLGGYQATKPWLDGPFAAHVAYLAKMYPPQNTERFIVQGEQGEFTDELLIRSGVNSEVLMAIAKALLKGTDCVLREGAMVLVNGSGLHSRWRDFVTEETPKPSIVAVNRAILALGPGGIGIRRRIGGRQARYRQLPYRLVKHVAGDLLESGGKNEQQV